MKLTKCFFLTLFMFVAGILSTTAQNRMVSGQVVDLDDEPLPGVSVTVGGTSTGSLTDIDGNFKVSIPTKGADLNFAYIGHEPQTVKVSATDDNLKVIMREADNRLDEVIVVGYGKQKKVNLTGAVASIDAKELENRSAHSLSNMLQGAVAGLNITTSSGVPGSSPTVNVRGQASINGGSPLVLVDGSEGDIARVNPNDVESISVIKDASGAAIYGARAAFGVILITTKSGAAKDGKATVRYSGRVGWEEPTTSTDYMTSGYWSAYTVNTFYAARYDKPFIKYTDYDMQQLLARVNDKTENPDRPWIVEEVRNGKNSWVYYGNNDWYNTLYNKRHMVQQHNVSLSGGTNSVKYFVSGGLDFQDGIVKMNTDKFKRYNLRSKIDFQMNKYMQFSNNTSFYGSTYNYPGPGSIEDLIAYGSSYLYPFLPLQNPDGSYIYATDYIDNNGKIGNGRQIILATNSHRNTKRSTDFSNTSRLTITPISQLSVVADFTYRFYQNRNTQRRNRVPYRQYPGQEMQYYDSGAGTNDLSETFNTRNYYSVNAYATYNDTFNEVHNLTVTAGYNYETRNLKDLGATAQNLISDDLDDFNLVGPNSKGEKITTVSGGQEEYALSGFFGRVNYNYKGKYLAEFSGRYDGTSRFQRGHRWGFFPSGSIGWRISEEDFFADARTLVNNLKLRLSYGSLGNQNVSDYYPYLRLVNVKSFAAFTFGEGSNLAQYAALGVPSASDLTWETSKQWNLGVDFSMLNDRLNFTGDVYIRDTDNMLTEGIALPSVYGEDEPQMNAADLRTKGYEVSVQWRDAFSLAGHRFSYNVGFNLSEYRSEITKFDNPDKLFSKKYYEGMQLGEIWGYRTGGLFATEQEAQDYAKAIDLGMFNTYSKGWHAGDLKYLDLNGNDRIDKGGESAINPGDKEILGNSLPRLSYGITAGFNYFGFDASVFFQGTGNHYWYPNEDNHSFWGPYASPLIGFIPKDLWDNVWSEDNPDAYFPRPVAYTAYSGVLNHVNDRYLQNIRYLRLKNLTVGYTIPAKLTKRIGIDNLRVYFSGENLTYWSPVKKVSKYVDPEGCIDYSGDKNRMAYSWQKSFMFGLDLSF